MSTGAALQPKVQVRTSWVRDATISVATRPHSRLPSINVAPWPCALKPKVHVIAVPSPPPPPPGPVPPRHPRVGHTQETEVGQARTGAWGKAEHMGSGHARSSQTY